MNLDSLCAQAMQHLQRGNAAEAERLYLQVLKLDPHNFAAQNFLGAIRVQQGRHAEALTLIQAALKINPKAASALANGSLALQGLGRFDEALAMLDTACAVEPNTAGLFFNRANLLLDLKRYDQAIQNCDRALTLRPNFFQALYNKGVALAAKRQFEPALDCYDGVLALMPQFPAALAGRGSVLRNLGRNEEALAVYEKFISAVPNNPEALYNRGLVHAGLGRHDDAVNDYDTSLALRPAAHTQAARADSLIALKRYEEAVAAFDRALALRPDVASAWHGRGVALWHLQRYADALASTDRCLALDAGHVEALYARALLLTTLLRFDKAQPAYDRLFRTAPNHAEASNSYGSLLIELGRFEEAVRAFDNAIANKPHHVDALFNRFTVQWTHLKRFEPALSDLEKVVSLDPTYEYARGDLVHLRMLGGLWQGLESDIQHLIKDVRAGQRVARPFMFQAISESPSDLLTCAKTFTAQQFPACGTTWTAAHRRGDKIRIGYLSSDFREQATAYLTAELYELHDRARFEVIAVDSKGADESAMRKRLEKAFDRFINISHMSDDAAATAIDAQGIDILVNLNGYFGRRRMGVFARRAAPIQVNYLGFPGTLGADYMDYIVADRVVLPEDEARFYCEKIVWLPDSYQVNDRKRIIGTPPTRAACGLPQTAFVFCNFNQSYKLTPAMFTRWMDVLKAVDGSVLWLYESNKIFSENMKREAAARGVDPARVIFAPDKPPAEHLARLSLADLFLDAWPYNAHTTASDALWAGVPLITCRGSAFPGRVAESLLRAFGVPELVAGSPEEYFALALRLAHEPGALRAIRDKIARHRLTQPLFDSARYCRNLESAYVQMHARWRSGEPPQSFTIQA